MSSYSASVISHETITHSNMEHVESESRVDNFNIRH